MKNKKGMTLVECIVAMGVFAVATTGFVMAASVSMRSQAKSASRMTKTNTQSTNLEHFSSYSHVLDPEYSNVRPMSSGTNQWQMTYKFKNATIVNDNIYGYIAKLDPDDREGVFDLSFFSSADQLTLGDGEYWVTLYNFDGNQHTWDITCPPEFSFFDNEKDDTAQQTLPRHIWAPSGGYMKFGIKQKTPGVGDIKTCLRIHSVEESKDYTVGVQDKMPNKSIAEGGDNMCHIYFNNGVFMNPEDFNKTAPEVE